MKDPLKPLDDFQGEIESRATAAETLPMHSPHDRIQSDRNHNQPGALEQEAPGYFRLTLAQELTFLHSRRQGQPGETAKLMEEQLRVTAPRRLQQARQLQSYSQQHSGKFAVEPFGECHRLPRSGECKSKTCPPECQPNQMNQPLTAVRLDVPLPNVPIDASSTVK